MALRRRRGVEVGWGRGLLRRFGGGLGRVVRLSGCG